MSDMRFNIYKAAPELVQGLIDVEAAISASPLDKGLNHLIKLRASQINGCAHCVEMHTREDGETDARLDSVIVWRDTKHFTDAHRAALAWAEARQTREAEQISTGFMKRWEPITMPAKSPLSR